MTDPRIPSQNDPGLREVRYEYTPEFPAILQHAQASLAITTYQAGKLAVVGVEDGKLAFSFHDFDQAMGIAVGSQTLAVGSRREVHFLQAAHEIAARIPPAGSRDSCWAIRHSFHTGNIHAHEMAWGRNGLWVVNTLFSSLCTLEDTFSFVPHWQPAFITDLEGTDRCHLNGLAMLDGQPKYVTAHGTSNEPAGWRPDKATGGVIMDVASRQIVTRNLAMPHSPRLHDGRLWVCHSGVGALETVDPATGQRDTVETFPGYTRGLAFQGQFAFIGLSKIRETSVFGDIPIAQDRHELRCGVGVVDLTTGRTVAVLQFYSGVDEIFGVEVLPGCLRPEIHGPRDYESGQQEIWVVPSPKASLQHDQAPKPTAGADNSQLVQRAAWLHHQGRLAESVQTYEQAINRSPQLATLHSDLGNVWQDLGDQDKAQRCYQRAIEIDPDCVPARQNLGYLSLNYGDPEEALRHFAHVNARQPTPISQLLEATVLPAIPASSGEQNKWRDRLELRVQELADRHVQLDTTSAQVPTMFFLAYHGRNDVDVMKNLGRIYTGPALCAAAQEPLKPRSDGRLRVGFLSAHFCDHTIGRLNLGRVQHLCRKRFEVTVFHAGHRTDEVSAAFDAAADRAVRLSSDLEDARRKTADQDLDVLIFADVGMNAFTGSLAYSRMAPVQCTTWGHPDTTGSQHIDYFLSSELLEDEQAQSHFTETLVRLPLLATYYQRPHLAGWETAPSSSAARDAGRRLLRAEFGLPVDRNIYLCPQTLFKFHPDFDQILIGILKRDPQGMLVLLEGRVPNWTARLSQRLGDAMPGFEQRVRFMPALPRERFLALLASADVILDPLHFGGGNTTYEALALGTPVVSLPGEFLRGRITQALYRRMTFTDLIVSSADEYIHTAIHLGTDRTAHTISSSKILSACPILFENDDEVRVLDEWLWSLTKKLA